MRDIDFPELFFPFEKSTPYRLAIFLSAVGNRAVNAGITVIAHERQALTALTHLLAHSVIDTKAPPLFSATCRLVADDFLPVFCAVYLYYLAQYFYHSSRDYLPVSLQYSLESAPLFFTSALFIFSQLKKIQFHMRNSVMLFEFPKAFQAMKGTSKIDNAICIDCNQLRFTKGEIRAFLLYHFRYYYLWSLEKIPVIGLLFSWITPFFGILFTGQFIAECHYASAGICERHRLANYNEYSELFFSLGLLHKTILYFLMGINFFASQSIFPLLTVFEKTIEAYPFLTPLLFIKPFLMPLAAIPNEAYESFFSVIALFYLIGLAYYMPFPPLVKTSKRLSFDFYSRDFLEIIIEGFIAFQKKGLKQWISETAEEKKSQQDDALVIAQRIENRKKFISQLFFVRCYRYANSALTFVEKNVSQIVVENKPIQSVLSFFLPTMLQHPDSVLMGVLLDPVIAPYAPKVLVDCKNALISIKNFIPVLQKVFFWGKKINDICNNRAFQWLIKGVSLFIPVSGVSLLPKIAEILTAEFIMEKLPAFLENLQSVADVLHDRTWIETKDYDSFMKDLSEVKKNIAILKKLCHELPASIIDDLLLWMRTREFYDYLDLSIAFFNSKIIFFVNKSSEELKALGYECLEPVVVEALDWSDEASIADFLQKALAEEVESRQCAWPVNLSTEIVPPAPNAAEPDEWDDVGDSENLFSEPPRLGSVAGTLLARVFPSKGDQSKDRKVRWF